MDPLAVFFHKIPLKKNRTSLRPHAFTFNNKKYYNFNEVRAKGLDYAHVLILWVELASEFCPVIPNYLGLSTILFSYSNSQIVLFFFQVFDCLVHSHRGSIFGSQALQVGF